MNASLALKRRAGVGLFWPLLNAHFYSWSEDLADSSSSWDRLAARLFHFWFCAEDVTPPGQRANGARVEPPDVRGSLPYLLPLSQLIQLLDSQQLKWICKRQSPAIHEKLLTLHEPTPSPFSSAFLQQWCSDIWLMYASNNFDFWLLGSSLTSWHCRLFSPLIQMWFDTAAR